MKNITKLFFILAFSFGSTLMAQTVVNVKEKKVLIDLGGASWNIGDKLFATDGQGKKRALMQIRQVKGTKAVAEIIKGAATPGMSLIVAKAGSSGGSSSSDAPVARGKKTGSAYGYTAALMMNSMKISNFVSGSTSYSFDMAGMNFGAGMFYDYPLSSTWFVRGHGTLEMFDVKKKLGVAICKGGTSTDCNASFMQTGFYGTFNLSLTPAPMRWWAGAGGGAVIYLSKTSTVLNTSKFFFNTVIMAAGGFDYFTSKNTFIPVALEYQMIPDKEAGVTSMVVRAGWGKTF